MSLPAQPRVLLRQSLYIWVLMAMVGILSLSFVAFRAISLQMQTQKIDPVYDRFDEMQLESARNILQSSGEPALKNYLDSLNSLFGGSHYLLNANGTDLVTGESRVEMLPAPPAVKSRTERHRHWEITHRAQDGKFWFAAEGQDRSPGIWSFLPLFPRDRRDRHSVLDRSGRRDFADSQNRREYCPVWAGKPGRARRFGSRRRDRPAWPLVQ